MHRNPGNLPTEKGSQGHQEFLQLCALSTSGDLSEEEQIRLRDHLATCAECRKVFGEFQVVTAIGVPLLSTEFSGAISHEPGPTSDQLTEPTRTCPPVLGEQGHSQASAKDQSGGLILARRNGGNRMQMNWSYVWMSLAAAMVLAATLGIYSYQFGRRGAQQAVRAAPPGRVPDLARQISDAGHDREVLRTQLAERDTAIAGLRRQMLQQFASLNEMKVIQDKLEQSLESDHVEKRQIAQERTSLAQELDATEASLHTTQAEFGTLREQRAKDQSQVESLEAQIQDLNGLLRDREQRLHRQEELLAHDRDIRDLIGARNLYIAEIYDVAGDGTTQKPYARAFYTKGKSLVFYAYDLDQQPGVRNTSSFQAWGRTGSDHQQALSLGIFYRDSESKKRWILKLDNPRVLEQIDAVFVTVEPTGGSHKPSGKPLLFASLKIEPNHP